jgi:hypothetical protein
MNRVPHHQNQADHASPPGVRVSVLTQGNRDTTEEDMRIRVKASHLPARIMTGAFILNSGVGKLSADEETAAQFHGFAAGTYPFLKKLEPKDFVKLLAATEITLGVGLLLPIVPSALVGAGLAAFSGGLLGIYAKTPGMHKEHSPFPTEQGTALAKDAWMTGIGLTLAIDDLTDRPQKRG